MWRALCDELGLPRLPEDPRFANNAQRVVHRALVQAMVDEQIGQKRRAGCAAPIPYELDVDLASSPLRCSGCRCAWVPSLHRAAGGCVALDPRESGQIRLWAEYVDAVVAGDPRIHRNRPSLSHYWNDG